MTRNMKLGIGGVVGLAIIAFLAFGVFGIHTAFIDDEVSEANPFDEVGAGETTNPFVEVEPEMAERFDEMEQEVATGAIVVEALVETTEQQADMPDEIAEPDVQTLATNNGVLVDHAHHGEGTTNIISDGSRTFLRFEDDFAIDNGPDLNVYLVRGVGADGPAGQFDDDFVDLGDLKGNIGAQNYQIPPGVDITLYDTVVIWCVRFGVAFNAADLA